MADDDDADREKREMRGMLIFAAAVAVFILALMGANMLFHHDSIPGSTEMSTQSRTAPP
jgi:hypothetical protein